MRTIENDFDIHV